MTLQQLQELKQKTLKKYSDRVNPSDYFSYDDTLVHVSTTQKLSILLEIQKKYPKLIENEQELRWALHDITCLAVLALEENKITNKG